MNSRITNKERNLLKGAIRRVFSRSELRKRILDLSRVDYSDPTRPRVKKWSRCFKCDEYTPTYLMEVDHIYPVVPIEMTLQGMTWDEVVDRQWCGEAGLQAICQACHKEKTKIENQLRRELRAKTKPKKRRKQ